MAPSPAVAVSLSSTGIQWQTRKAAGKLGVEPVGTFRYVTGVRAVLIADQPPMNPDFPGTSPKRKPQSPWVAAAAV